MLTSSSRPRQRIRVVPSTSRFHMLCSSLTLVARASASPRAAAKAAAGRTVRWGLMRRRGRGGAGPRSPRRRGSARPGRSSARSRPRTSPVRRAACRALRRSWSWPVRARRRTRRRGRRRGRRARGGGASLPSWRRSATRVTSEVWRLVAALTPLMGDKINDDAVDHSASPVTVASQIRE